MVVVAILTCCQLLLVVAMLVPAYGGLIIGLTYLFGAAR